MHPFLYGILGGFLVGISAAVLLLYNGDQMGASGIVASVMVSPKGALERPEQHWKLVFLSSFCLASNLFFATAYEDLDGVLGTMSPWAFLLGGVLVGFGTKLSNGCTSGHGICGLARFSLRSFAAVCVFMVIGILAAYLTQAQTTPFALSAFAFLRNNGEDTEVRYFPKVAATVLIVLNLAALMAPTFHNESSHSQTSLSNSRRKMAPAAFSGALFAIGLYVSRMVFPKYVFGFLNLGLFERGGDNWDPTLMFVMGGGVIVSLLSYQWIQGYSYILPEEKTLSKPILAAEGSEFHIPENKLIDGPLIIGAIIFGLGWGITGLCPAPAIFLAAIGVDWLLVCYWPAFVAGAFIASEIQQRELFGVKKPCDTSKHTTEPLESSEIVKSEDKLNSSKMEDLEEGAPDSEEQAKKVEGIIDA